MWNQALLFVHADNTAVSYSHFDHSCDSDTVPSRIKIKPPNLFIPTTVTLNTQLLYIYPNNLTFKGL